MKSFPLSSILMTATFALAPLAVLTAPVAAQAQSTGDYRCTGLAAQVQQAAANSTDAAAVQRAQRLIANGRALCEARSEGPAARQYRSALRVLGVEEVRPADGRMIATTTSPSSGN